MKRILITTIAITAVACCPKQNDGARYNTVTTEAAVPENNMPDVSRYKKGHVVGVSKYESEIEVCTAYYGEFNGHTWYVFYGNLAAPAVVHDPLCACGGGE